MSDKFHKHLDICERCRQETFNLCPLGARLIHETAASLETKPVTEDRKK